MSIFRTNLPSEPSTSPKAVPAWRDPNTFAGSVMVGVLSHTIGGILVALTVYLTLGR
jgi:hypothetical protein